MISVKKAGTALTLALLLNSSTLFAQKTIKEYVDDAGKEKLKKSATIADKPVTAKGYSDGHGKNPLLTSAAKLPKKIALITFYIFDIGSSDFSKAGNVITYHSLSPKGGNLIANEALKNSITQMKAAFAKEGATLVTIDEVLTSPDKKKYYYETFAPNISKIGTVLSGMETKRNDISVTADDYRALDVAASTDYLRAESLGNDLAKKLGVDAVLSIAIEIQSDGKQAEMHGAKMTLNGPNPVTKEDKKYIGQKMGTGYYAGQVYGSGSMFFKKPIKVLSLKKKDLGEMNFEGLGLFFDAFIEKMYDEMKESIADAAKKYN